MRISKLSCNFVCAAILLLCLQSSSQSQTTDAKLPMAMPQSTGLSLDGLSKVDDAMRELVAQKRIPGGVVMVARFGKVVHFKAYGLQNTESASPMRTDSIFRIYSMTKSIVTASALMLHDEGKLGVGDPVSKYLPELKNVRIAGNDGEDAPAHEMTIADLMRHTSGYGYGTSGNRIVDDAFKVVDPLNTKVPLSRLQSKLPELPLLFNPGTDWKYGISIDILGRVVEVVSKKTLHGYLEEKLFTPLGMRDTSFHVPAEKLDRFTDCYNSDGKGNLTISDAAATSPYLQRPLFEGGGGGLVSTASDYMRFLMMIQADGTFQGRRYLKAESIQLMKTNQIPNGVGWVKFGGEIREGVGFSYGFSVRDKMSDWDPDGRVGEYGWGGMASTHYWVSPKDDLIVITMEQVLPYSFLTEFKIKGLIYDSIKPK